MEQKGTRCLYGEGRVSKEEYKSLSLKLRRLRTAAEEVWGKTRCLWDTQVTEVEQAWRFGIIRLWRLQGVEGSSQRDCKMRKDPEESPRECQH